MGSGKLQFEGFHSAKSILRKYNPQNDEWDFPRTGEFWDAVRTAHNNGFTGEGQTIAVIDSGFDLKIPKLKTQSGGKVEQSAGWWKNTTHGTIVALLILEVAPKAKLRLYEVASGKKPSPRKVKKALQRAAESDATIINLSLGRAIHKNDKTELGDHHCALCHFSSLAAKKGKRVVASVGNHKGDLFCPATHPEIVGIGFQSEIKENYDTSDGGMAENAIWHKPSFSQALNADFTLIQPQGVLGSSFAAPLVCGAIALADNSAEINKTLEAVKIGGHAEKLHAQLHKNRHNSKKDIEETERAYLVAINHLPHLHTKSPIGVSCVACSLFVQALYVNAGLFFLEAGEWQLSEALLKAACWLAPWSPHAWANLATLMREKAMRSFQESNENKINFSLINDSLEGYRKAIQLKPDCESYRSGLNSLEKWLAEIS